MVYWLDIGVSLDAVVSNEEDDIRSIIEKCQYHC